MILNHLRTHRWGGLGSQNPLQEEELQNSPKWETIFSQGEVSQPHKTTPRVTSACGLCIICHQEVIRNVLIFTIAFNLCKDLLWPGLDLRAKI